MAAVSIELKPGTRLIKTKGKTYFIRIVKL